MRKFVVMFLLLFAFTLTTYLSEASPYDSHSKRDPFVPLVGTHARASGSLEDVMSIEDVDLQGIANDSAGSRVAIINGEMIREAQTIGRVTVKNISKNTVLLLIDEDEYKLNIYEEKY